MSALVESPLQLLCAVEAHAAGHTEGRLRITARQGVPTMPDTVAALRELGLPDGVDVQVGPARRALAPEEPWVCGDPFSGAYQAALSTGTPSRQVVVDDGLGTLDVVDRLVSGRPLVRLSAPRHPVRRVLGAMTTRRLRRQAARGGLTLCTMLPLGDARRAALSRLGVEVVEHSFEWLASHTPTGPGAAGAEPTVVVGSALVADRLVHPDHYLTWLRGLAADGPVRYVPHRRHHPLVTAAVETLPGVRVDAPGAPVELRLRGLDPDQQVVSLPSTSAVTLTRLLGPRGVRVTTHDVPDSWWTPHATPALRDHLRRAALLARAATPSRRPSPARVRVS
ncbi:hypothetical protein [Isoptericola sp. 178]|uniref:hypothetical protein n=1 Tax=Isoptericola sp. 178 TaxID=3064651 RepID=UPI0027133B21|nr:hypothetical protein [Isoptericola sp. 178]MDO8144139.1 hypothetical protein [Isoptericola sp. 178]